MKEQVIAARPPRRATGHGKVGQRPVRRDGRPVESERFSLRSLSAYVPRALKVALVILAFIGLAIGYRAASSASLFQVRAIDVVGTSRTSAEEIEGLARRAVSRSGVWRADLSALSVELGRLPGVRRAVVTRVLPDGLRVRIIERIPVAVVRTSSGHFLWVDDEGVALGEVKPNDQMPPFFIRGWNEDGTNEAREENTGRVKKYQEALREWQAAGLTDRVSEISLFDVHDVRAQLTGRDAQIEVRLGSQDLGRRLKEALDVLDDYRQTPSGPSINYVDSQGSKVVLGRSSGAKVSAEPDGTDNVSNEAAEGAGAAATAAARNAQPEKPADKKPRARTSDASVKPAASPRPPKRPTANRNG